MKEKLLTKKNIFIACAVAIFFIAVIAAVAAISEKNCGSAQGSSVSSSAEGGNAKVQSSTESEQEVVSQTVTVDTKTENIDKNPITEKTEIKTVSGIELPYELENGIYITKFLVYDGYFTEDLSYEQTEGALAVEIKNKGDKFVEAMAVSLIADDGTKLEFWASRIAPGDVTVLQEKNNAKYKDNLSVTVNDITVGYMDGPWNTDIVKYIDFLSTKNNNDENVAVVANKTDKTITNIKVYYKRNINDIYIGGYTYVLNIEQLLPNETVYMNAKFFNTECVIVDSQFTIE